jgi:hypothetical protein
MSPEKELFLKEIVSQSKGKEQKEMIPFMMAMITQAKQQNINFTTEEAMLLFAQMKGNLSEEEQNRLMQIFHFMQMQEKKH